MLSYTYHFYNQTDVYFFSKGLSIPSIWIAWLPSFYRLSLVNIGSWSLAAKLNLVEAIK